MIELKNVTKYYKIKKKKHYILNNVSCKFPEGKSIGILGKNGAGKSTLLRILGGVEKPNEGKVDVSSSISWPVGLASGFQGSLNAEQNIKFVCQIYNKTKKEKADIIKYVKDFADIGDFFYTPVKSYSSGMRSRINFGLSMAFDFDYYLVDEATSVGDASFKKKAKTEFDKKKDTSNIILVSHSMKEIKRYADIGILLKDGALEIYNDIDEAISQYLNI
mgnify:CR=1 FL=1